MGRGSAYNITKENLAKVFDKIKEEKKELTGIELAKSFYEEYGKDMIHNNFSEYEDKIAVGFVGKVQNDLALMMFIQETTISARILYVDYGRCL